jgi:subtilisin family serine protease
VEKYILRDRSKVNMIKWYGKPLFYILLFIAITAGITFNSGYTMSNEGLTPVGQHVFDELAIRGDTEFLIVLKDQGDISGVDLIPTKKEKSCFIYDTLRDVAIESQADLLNWLDSRGVKYRRFWIVNQVLVRGDAALLNEILNRNDVDRIDANPAVRGITDPEPDPNIPRVSTPDTVEWGVRQINADDVWAYGVKGEGIVIAGQDTGVDWDHPALIDHYRGWDGINADHNYNWHDSIHNSTGNPCGNDSPAPCDDGNHGTHTMGTMIGDDGAGNQIGVAPGAKWIACRNMDEDEGTPATYTECFEWFIAPYPIGGDPFMDGDPAKAPHIINNSWSCPPSEGCNQDTLESIVATTRSAGIMVVLSNGNAGPDCSTTNNPPALYQQSFSVGATNSSDDLASFSSRGPVTYNGDTYIKPNISAPGVNIRSSINGGYYQSGWSGTSMAAPHVSGAVALLWSRLPSIIGDIDLTEDILGLTAFPKNYTSCGDPFGIPNNGYGYGILDVLNAIQNAIPQPDIKANGSDGPITISPGIPVNVTVALDPGALKGHLADWWIAAIIPDSTIFWYTLDSVWVKSFTPLRAYDGALFHLSPYTVLDGVTDLPAGSYLLGFAVDDNVNGVLELDWVDIVDMTIE